MQSNPAAKRLLSSLASRIHPQLPLSPRESQQLLNLLTTSFRAHLDREHPLPGNDSPNQRQETVAQRNSGSTGAPSSSYASATRHIDSILANPLFAVKPDHRVSEPTTVDVLEDPMAWFVNEIAMGSATLSKAATCLELLASSGKQRRTPHAAQSPATVIVEWLRSSGLDTSKKFVKMAHGRPSLFFVRLMALLAAESDTSFSWRWFIRSTEQRVKETGLSVATIHFFRKKLLSSMVAVQADTSLDQAISTFLQACRTTEALDVGSSHVLLNAAGGRLVTLITSNTTNTINSQLYQEFLMATHHWITSWKSAVDSMLWLHHPTEPSADPGLRFLRDPATAAMLNHSSPKRRQFAVQLCLGIARLSLQNEQYADAQFSMEFAKQHFPDIVLSESPASKQEKVYSVRKEQREQRNLEFLDGLALT